MGHGDHESSEAAPRRRTPLTAPRQPRPSIQALHLAALLEINTKIGALAPTDALLSSIAEEAARLLGVDDAGFRLLEGDELVLGGLAGSAAETMLEARLRVGESLSGKVVKEGRPMRAEFATSQELSPKTKRAAQSRGHTHFLGVPLQIGGRTIGVLTFRARRPFTDADQELAEAFAGQAAIAIDHARLVQEATRRTREANELAALAGDLTESLRVEEVLHRIVMAVVRLLRVRAANIRLLEPDGSLVLVARSDEPSAMSARGDVLPAGYGISGYVVAAGQTFKTADVLAEPALRLSDEVRERVVESGDHACLCVPLRTKGRIIGTIVLSDRRGRQFVSADAALLQSFADHGALALENARLYEETERRRREAEVLAQVARGLNEELDLDTVLQRVTVAGRDLCEADLAIIALRDPRSEVLLLRHAVGTRARAVNMPIVEPGKGAGGIVLETRRPFRTDDYLADPRIDQSYADAIRAEGIVAELVVPLVTEGCVEGLLYVDRRTPRPFTDRDESVLMQLADHAAVAIRNARLYHETSAYAERLRALDEVNRRRLEETRALLDLAEILNSTLDSRQLLKRAAIRIAQICKADRCSIARWDGRAIIPLMAQFGDGRVAEEQWRRFSRQEPWEPRNVPAYAEALQTRRPVVIHDTTNTELIPRVFVEWFGVKSCMIVPLVRQDQVTGVLTVDLTQEPRPFADWQVDLAMTVAGQVALSLENIRLYTEVEGRLRETQTLLSVAETLSQAGSPDEIMRRVMREVGRATTADMVGAWVMNERKDALVVLAGYHVPSELVSQFRERPITLSTFPFVAEALAMGRPAWSADALQDPLFDRDWLEGLPPHAVLFAPTLAQGRPMGALVLAWWTAGRPFPADEIALIEGVATQVGLALENAGLARQTRTKLGETETLLSVSRALASTLDLDALLRHFMREAARTLGADTSFFWMASGDGEWLEPYSGYHVPPEMLDQTRSMRVSMVKHAFYAEAVEGNRAVLSSLGDEDPRLPDNVRAVPHRSQLFVPIVAKERVIGGLGAVWWREARDLSESELRLVEALASQAGVAVENARLFTENRHQLAELAVLYDLSRAVTGEVDRAALFHAVHDRLARVMDVRNMVVMVHDADANDMEVALRMRDGVPNADPPLRYHASGVGLMSLVLAEARPIRTDDYAAACARLGVQALAPSLAFRHWLGVPMRAGEHVLGAIVVRNADRPYTEADERLLTNAADLTALALRSARLFEERARAFGQLSAAQDQLVRTEKLRALGEMASGVAHDFNNLLAAILGRAQLLLGRIEDPRLRKWLTVIERSALDGAQTVRRLQEFTRIRRDHPFVAVDLNQVVRETLDITQSRWSEEPSSRGVTIDVRAVLGDIPRVPGDPVELREALTNLILNAIDAMSDGGTLTLRTAVADGQVELVVSDTGVGMPETIRQRIFDPFFTTKGAQGTGLGLSITYGILTRHRARVQVESAPGQGTMFRLTFEAGGPADEPEVPAPTAAPSSESLRCLIVDDEEAVGAVLGDILEANGHAAIVFTSGAEAVERFRAEPFDLVFTDLAMPGLTGWQVARGVKSVAPSVPVFLVTGFGVELTAEEQREHGVDRVLTKPLSIQLVLDAVASASRHG